MAISAIIQRWVGKCSPLLEEALHRRKRPVWVIWRLDETWTDFLQPLKKWTFDLFVKQGLLKATVL